MSLYTPRMDDRKNAILYWRGRELKVFAVDVTAGNKKKPAYACTWYARARTQESAIESVKQQALGLPRHARYQARLAGPQELGCVPTS